MTVTADVTETTEADVTRQDSGPVGTTASPATDGADRDRADQDGSAGADGSKPRRGRPKGTTGRKTRTVTLTLTVTGTADGDWQAELKNGSTWVARELAVPAAAVSRAARELHADLSAPIDEVINAAREQQEARVAALEAELEAAKRALADLDS